MLPGDQSDFVRDIEANSPGTRGIKALVAAVLHPSCRAALLMRSAGKRTGLSYWIVRNLLLTFHSIDVGRGATIGPGLALPHPFGIVVGKGAVVGSNVTIYHHVTLGNKRGYPKVCDGATIYPGATVVGPIEVGVESVIGANAFVDRDVVPKGSSFGRSVSSSSH